VQANCNYQLAAWVIGLMGDYDWTNATGATPTYLLPHWLIAPKSDHSHPLRVGLATRGIASSPTRRPAVHSCKETTASCSRQAQPPPRLERRGGWTVGIGAEYAFLDWLTGFLEYDYSRFASTAKQLPLRRCGLFAPAVSFNTTANIKRLKLG